ncbi:GPI-anchored wall transfer 1 [Pyrrhoderma noxium]|uniref:GPI-anchored wall transfer protein n=1 Tax=Pyrrhoderma noxium TaxID=2282107 RepID=A0A286UDV0_9AGAM|nr:GPI-anchored wall transfer 1 [Pyrrhoderma noxium]
MGDTNYKESKEAFVSGATGSSVLHVNLVSSVALLSIALYYSLISRWHNSTNFALEWSILVAPLLLSMTLFAERPLLLCFLLSIPIVLIHLYPAKDFDEPPLSPISISRSASPTHTGNNASDSGKGSSSRIIITPLPALTIYRAHMMLMTILAILAVDFPVFPRSLAKCETFGVSLMDLGVGSFVFSQGVVSAIPLLKDPSYLIAPSLSKLIDISRKVLPLFFLGMIRVISVKGTEYPEHVTEYGVHWNFFFTLAVLPILQVALHPLIVHLPISLLGFLVALLHQLLLSLTALQDFALNAPRDNIISANKEGLISLTGYLAIQLLGLSAGTVLLPPSPSDFRRQQNILQLQLNPRAAKAPAEKPVIKSHKRQNDKTAIELFSYSFLWWTCLGICYLTDLGGGISRRLTNLPYVIWVAAYNVTFIAFYLILDGLAPKSAFNPVSRPKEKGLAPKPINIPSTVARHPPTNAPALLSAINLNGLLLFLVSNVATGLVNLSMPTMYASDAAAMVVLSLYSAGVCLVAWMLRRRRVWKL